MILTRCFNFIHFFIHVIDLYTVSQALYCLLIFYLAVFLNFLKKSNRYDVVQVNSRTKINMIRMILSNTFYKLFRIVPINNQFMK